MKEDQLTNAIIQKLDTEKIIEPEAHYNHYGTRGVVDLYVRNIHQRKPNDHLYEIKANPKDANKVIRQFQKMRNYFYRDKDRAKPEKTRFELCFTAEPGNLQHVKNNSEMYRSLAENYPNVIITFRHPENIRPVHIFTRKWDVDSKDFWRHAEREKQAEKLETGVV